MNEEKLNEIVNHAFSFGYGGMSIIELKEVGKLCIDKKVLELGSMVGMSTYIMAMVGKHVDTIDVWSDTQEHLSHDTAQADVYAGFINSLPNMYNAFCNNCKELLENKKITPYRGKTGDMAKYFKNKKYDIILFDADHSYKGISEDYNNYKKAIRNNGLYVFHDWGDVMWTSIKKFTDELIDKKELKFLYNVERIAVFEKYLKKEENGKRQQI